MIRVADAFHPGLCRVVWREHVAEMTDLLPADRRHLFAVVMATEAALRAQLHPDKINLASFGNMVPHLHWHVIPRYRDDRHFPEAVWGAAQREGVAHAAADPVALARAIDDALAEH
ncbi:diadenosine tetraphosphate (Ap4A) hydrolase-like protein [Thauera chlorobenzoica]|uniref:Diadenosine tetraphosphate (Ap4A) hydrolase-like protein n=1 Tax=Thauera chlorobenzoica TaxID=96773 RepID=A0A1L6F7W8_9RHOO|nr:diadenosine tetraphosphate (Ap4A) hydrolase-like protein [Thauera chlorobenzoica]